MNEIEWMEKKLRCSVAQSIALGLIITSRDYGIIKRQGDRRFVLAGTGRIFPGAIFLLESSSHNIDDDIANAIGVDLSTFRMFKEGLFGRGIHILSTDAHKSANALGFKFKKEYLL